MALLLVSHRMEQVFDLADRILVLRHGRLVADVSPLEVHPDDVVDLMAGMRTDSTARKQLHRLHSLVDQLSEVAPSASLPLIVSAIATALDQQQVCVHLLDAVDERRAGRARPARPRSACPSRCSTVTDRRAPRPVGRPDRRRRPPRAATWSSTTSGRADRRAELADAARRAGVVSAWAVPDPRDRRRARRHLRVVADPRPAADRAARAGVALRRARRRRHRARAAARRGEPPQPDPRDAPRRARDPGRPRAPAGRARDRAARALPGPAGRGRRPVRRARPTASSSASLVVRRRRRRCRRATAETAATLRDGAQAVLDGPSRLEREPPGRSRPGGRAARRSPRVAACSIAWWSDPVPDHRRHRSTCSTTRPGRCAWPSSARRSTPSTRRPRALRRSRDHQRAFLSRISHELRTPLTAIHGYASSLNQTDVSWDDDGPAPVPRPHRRWSRLAWAGWSATCSTRRRSTAGCSRCRATGASSTLIVAAAAACVPGRDRRGRGRRRPGGRSGLGRSRPARAGLREPARERGAPRRRARGHRGRRPARPAGRDGRHPRVATTVPGIPADLVRRGVPAPTCGGRRCRRARGSAWPSPEASSRPTAARSRSSRARSGRPCSSPCRWSRPDALTPPASCWSRTTATSST